MSIRVRSLAPFLAAWAVLATLILSTPAGQANPGTAPASASRFAHEIRNKNILKGVMR